MAVGSPWRITSGERLGSSTLRALKSRQRAGTRSLGTLHTLGQVCSYCLTHTLYSHLYYRRSVPSQELSVKIIPMYTYYTKSSTDANIDLRVGLGKAISSISSIPTTWSWTYSSASSDLVADISYDLWLSNTAGTSGASSTSTYEM